MPTVAEHGPGTATGCAHCGLSVARGDFRGDDGPQFCCDGCRTVSTILHEHGLEQFYDLPQRRPFAVASSSRTFDEFDHPAFQALCVQQTPGGIARVALVLEGVHCASCVWLVERVPLLVRGTLRAELDIRRAVVTIEWDPTIASLSSIARTLASLGYAPHPHHGGARDEVRARDDRAALVRIGVAGALAVNIMLVALAMYSGWFGNALDKASEQFFRWLSLCLIVPALLGPGRVFFRGAWAALRTRTLHLDLPIALALGAGFVRGATNTIIGHGPIYFDGVAILVFLLLVGRYLQQRWQRSATDASELLYSLTPDGCRIAEDSGEVREIPAAALVPGMLLVVRPGDTLAADGVVESGSTSFNVAWLTGEAKPLAVHPGDSVLAGTLNVEAPVRVRVTRAGAETRVARVLQQVESSARRRAPVVLLANQLAGWFVGIVLLLAAITFMVWVGRGAGAALDHAIALLIVTCPCALAMATPLSVTVALGRAARQGIFVKGGDSLQVLSGSGALLLDKTGTITEGRSALVSWTGPNWVRPHVLALEEHSLHPVADGFRRAWPGLSASVVTESSHVSGGGVRGRVEGHDLVVGSPRFVRDALALAGQVSLAGEDLDPTTPVWVAVDGAVIATARFGDPLRAHAAATANALRARGWTIGLLSGDAPAVCHAVAGQIGVAPHDVVAEATPEMKRDVVARARTQGRAVVMIGDGVNDTNALATASVGIAVHGGAEAALVTADVYLTQPGLEPVVALLDGAQRTMRVIRRNIAFSLAYNVVGVGLAMSGTINPVIAAIMMPLSSLTVVAGAWYGRTFDAPS